MLSTSLGRPPMAGFNTGGAGLSCGSPQPAYGYSSDGWTHRVAIVYAQITTTYPKNTHDSRFGISDGRMTEITGGDLRVGMQVITGQQVVVKE